jgi:crotonobetaine/carnitine-CoA ligase
MRADTTPVMERTLGHVFEKAIKERPDQVAILSGDTAYSYAQLYSDCLRIGNGLVGLGLQPHEPVLLMLDNHCDFVRAWIAVSLFGGVEVPVNTAYKGAVLEHLVRDSGATLLVAEAKYVELFEEIFGEMKAPVRIVVRGNDPVRIKNPRVTVTLLDDLISQPEGLPVPLAPWDPLGILYTSGTTGPAKGVVASHGYAHNFAPQYISASERIVTALPLFHIGGQWTGVYAALRAGGSIAILPAFHASTFWQEADGFDCTQTLLVGAMARFLMNQPPSDDDRLHSIMRVNMCPIISDVAVFAERFDVSVCATYGLTEGSTPMVTDYGSAAPQFAGWVREDFEARISDDNDVELAPGEVGEILVRPKEPWSVMSGYHGLPDRTAEAFRNLWLHTGDLGYRDTQGRYFFVDRKDDAMRVRGENVSSYEVESVVDAHPAVLTSVAVAVQSENTEDEIKVVVVLDSDASLQPEDLTYYLIDRLPYFMVPRYIEFVDELPRTPTEKVRRDVLRQTIVKSWDREAAGIHVGRRR